MKYHILGAPNAEWRTRSSTTVTRIQQIDGLGFAQEAKACSSSQTQRPTDRSYVQVSPSFHTHNQIWCLTQNLKISQRVDVNALNIYFSPISAISYLLHHFWLGRLMRVRKVRARARAVFLWIIRQQLRLLVFCWVSFCKVKHSRFFSALLISYNLYIQRIKPIIKLWMCEYCEEKFTIILSYHVENSGVLMPEHDILLAEQKYPILNTNWLIPL